MKLNVSEARSILNLAWPVMLSRAGAFIIITVDTAMCGRFSTDELAYYGISGAPLLPALLIGIGMLVGIAILTASADGANTPVSCGHIWRIGLLHAMILGFLLGLTLQAGEQILALGGQSDAMAEGGGRVLRMHGWGMPGLLGVIATTLFLEGLQRPFAGMVVMLGANLVNFVLNWIFIFGNLGAPAMGAEGAAFATTIVRWLSFFALAAYVLYSVDRVKYGLLSRIPAKSFREISRKLRQLGYPAALAHCMESSSFAVMTLFAGIMGVLQTAVWSAVMQLIAIAFMFALGFTMAASVRVANHIGQRNFADVGQAGWISALLGTVIMIIFSVLFFVAPSFFSTIYSNDPAVIMLTAPVVVLAAFAIIPDGLQAVLVGALRGLQDMWFITLTMFVSWWAVMLPIAYFTGVHQGGGPAELMISVAFGAAVAVCMLAARFRYKCRL